MNTSVRSSFISVYVEFVSKVIGQEGESNELDRITVKDQFKFTVVK